MNKAMILVALSTAGLQACVMVPAQPVPMVVRQPPVMVQQPRCQQGREPPRIVGDRHEDADPREVGHAVRKLNHGHGGM